MNQLTRLERVVFLQRIAPFTACSAEEVLRIAAIAREEVFPPQHVIFDRHEPADHLFVVVGGRVRLETGPDLIEAIGDGTAFGIEEVLSGRLRSRRAVAEKSTRTLVIEADDFFDLLSNNIEIVKALFRQLLPDRTP